MSANDGLLQFRSVPLVAPLRARTAPGERLSQVAKRELLMWYRLLAEAQRGLAVRMAISPVRGAAYERVVEAMVNAQSPDVLVPPPSAASPVEVLAWRDLCWQEAVRRLREAESTVAQEMEVDHV